MAAALVAAAAHAQGAAPPTWPRALEAAWQRSRAQGERQGQLLRAQAERAAAARPWAGAPTLELDHRSGRDSAGGSQRESELGVSVAVWRPAQRQALQRAADADLQAAERGLEAGRWALAGELREAGGLLRAQEAETRQAELQVRLVRALAEDVDRRVRAGDLARADALAARAEVLQAEVQEHEAGQRRQAARQRWRLLTGFDQAPAPDPTPAAAGGVTPDHPELAAARQKVEAARRRLASAEHARRDPPEVGARVRRETGNSGAASSIGVSLRIPFGGDPRSEPAVAQARAELDLALADEQRTRERLALDTESARLQLRSTEQQLEAERARATLLRQRAELIDRSFRAGDTALPELLRALSAAAHADAAVLRQQAALEQAQARLSHSLGFLP